MLNLNGSILIFLKSKTANLGSIIGFYYIKRGKGNNKLIDCFFLYYILHLCCSRGGGGGDNAFKSIWVSEVCLLYVHGSRH